MFTESYYEVLKRSTEFQQKSINWAGFGSYQYVKQLQQLVTQHQCATMLDYGCGKGLQYVPGKNNFADLIGIKDYALHDPAYAEHAELPAGTWDIVLCLDVLPFIPESDIAAVVELMLSRCNKICVVALQSIPEFRPTRSKKPFVCVHDHEWWQAKLNHPQIHLIWNEHVTPFDHSEYSTLLTP